MLGIFSQDDLSQPFGLFIVSVVQRCGRRGQLFLEGPRDRGLTLYLAIAELKVDARPVKQRPLGWIPLNQIPKPSGGVLVGMPLERLHRAFERRHSFGRGARWWGKRCGRTSRTIGRRPRAVRFGTLPALW